MEYLIQNKNGYSGKMISSRQSIDLTLRKTDIFALNSEPNQTHIKCLSGILWITQNNDRKDYFIKEGQTFYATLPGLMLVQGFPFGRANITVHSKK